MRFFVKAAGHCGIVDVGPTDGAETESSGVTTNGGNAQRKTTKGKAPA